MPPRSSRRSKLTKDEAVNSRATREKRTSQEKVEKYPKLTQRAIRVQMRTLQRDIDTGGICGMPQKAREYN